MKTRIIIGLIAFSLLLACKQERASVPDKRTEIILRTSTPPIATPKQINAANPAHIPVTTPTPVIVLPTPQPLPKATPEPIGAAIVVSVPTAPPTENLFVVSDSKDDKPLLTQAGLDLIVYYEVGGEKAYKRNPFPEYSGAGSGVTWAIGYDAHQNKKTIIFSDWVRLGETPANRLAATQPYFSASAKVHVKDVKDINVPWDDAIDVFIDTDVVRTDTQCRKAFPGFDNLRPTAKDAIRSLVFNRGAAMSGPNRTEMRWMRDKGVPNKDYTGLAKAERDMKHIWKGTSIQAGMYARREAEAKLFETP